MAVYNVWFWAPFHMLQAYPMVRNSPLPDVLIPFSHLMWVPAYIAEHWTGLADPVQDAWDMKGIIGPLQLILVLSFFFNTHKMSNNKLTVKIGFVLYFSFMFLKSNFGFIGSPMKTYDDQIAMNADSSWNNQHVFLHVYYLAILWVVALTVPYSKLSALRAGADKKKNI